MDVALSDVLICPRCGPTYGLVLLPYEAVERRVRSGVLGCANCRERYPIEGGVADLRVAGAPTVESGGAESGGWSAAVGSEAVEGETAPAVRLAGLMGLAEARGTVLVAGPAAAHAVALAELLGDVEVASVGADGSEAGPRGGRTSAPGGGADAVGEGGVSRVRVGRALPFRSGSLRGVTLAGAWAGLVEEGGRVLGREGRLVLDPAPEDAAGRLAEMGLGVVAREGNVVVAARGE